MKWLPIISALALAGCAGTNTIQTSTDTMIVQTRAAPICGGEGAARTAQRQAAINTIKSGYDRYIIYDAAASSNISTSQMPGTYNTMGTYGGGWMHATTTYTPGPTIVSGSHRQSFAVKMFRDGDPGASRALSARAILGPKWQEAIKAGSIGTCFDGE